MPEFALPNPIGKIDIVEYHPEIFANHVGTGRYEPEKTMFHHYVDGEDGGWSQHSLERSLVYALDMCQHGRGGHHAAFYAAKLLDLPE